MIYYIDLFCGAGGTTTGIHRSGVATVLACVNHDPLAIASHAANHPDVLHMTEDIRTLDTAPIVELVKQTRARDPEAVIVIWASVECTNFSKAKGGLSRDPDSRTLAEHLYRYFNDIDPDYIQVENVVEFLDWGPLTKKRDKKTGDLLVRRNAKKDALDYVYVPDMSQRGKWFKTWCRHIQHAWWSGKHKPVYDCEYRTLNAADFGAYTTRTRLFVQFAKKGKPICWPKPTHTRKTWKACRDVLDLEDPGASIFGRKKPLVDSTLRRIYEGIVKFCPTNPAGSFTFMQRYFSGDGHVSSIKQPCGVLTTIPHQWVTSVTFMDNHFGNSSATSVDVPCGTLCTKEQRYPTTAVFTYSYYSGGGQLGTVESPFPAVLTIPKQRIVECVFLDQQFGKSSAGSLDRPFPAVTTNPHYSAVTPQFLRLPMRPQESNLVYTLDRPMPTVLTRDYYYLHSVSYEEYKNCVPQEGDTKMMLKLKHMMRSKGISDIKMRAISITESLRVMGFGEDYTLLGTKAQQRKYIGNAVECTVAGKMAEAVAEAVSEVA